MEITANASQTVLSNNNLLFTNVRVPGNCSILYQEGSGLVTLRGLCNGSCRRARFRIVFIGNIKADASASISSATLLSLAIAQNGEVIPVSTMTSTVEDTTTVHNIGTELYVDVPSCCCQTITVKNITTSTVDVLNANLIVERVA